MPKNLVDVSAFTSPVVVPVDGDPFRATPFETAYQALANRTKHLNDRFNGNGEVLLGGTQGYTFFIPASAGADEDITTPGFSRPDAEYARSEVNNARLIFNISPPVLPYACSLTSIHAIVDPGASRTGTNRMKSIIRLVEFGSVVAPSLSVADYYTSHGTDATQTTGFKYLIPETAMTPAVVAELVGTLLAIVQCGDDAATNKDKIYGIMLGLTTDRIQPI
jgi:hypothetical protein